LAATEDGDGYEVYLKDKSSDKYAKWHVDDKGGIVKGEFLSKSQLLEEEANSGFDINDDGVVDDKLGMIQATVSYELAPKQESVMLMLAGGDDINATGNELDNMIEGNVGSNILDGKDGVDSLTGHEGADTFLFSVVTSFGDGVADHITDFSSAEGDRLQISKKAFGISKNVSPTFQAVSRDSDLAAALASTSTLVYNSGDGSLYFNQNGSGVGFGAGGIFAVLDGAPQLQAGSISYV
jgi:Ca2+-binding RTX toxin-like protein